MQAYTSESPAHLYKADAAWCDQLRKTRQKVAGICGQSRNRTVRVQTLDGQVIDGVVVGSDNTYLYLMPTGARFFGPAGILTLVLYELLVITLLI